MLALLLVTWTLWPTEPRGDLTPYVAVLCGAALFLGLGRRLSTSWIAWGTIGLSIVGLMLLNLCHQPSRLPLLDSLRSAYWGIPLPGFLYRNTPLIIFTAGTLLAVAAVPRRRRTGRVHRAVASAGCVLALVALLFPGASYVHEHVPLTLDRDPSAVPVMVDGVLEQRLWIRSHEVGRPMLLTALDQVRSDHALADITHGLHAASLDGASPAWLGLLWTAQKAATVLLVPGRVALLPALLLIGFTSLAGTHRPTGALRAARRGLGALLLGPAVFNTIVLVGVAVSLLAGPDQWAPALLWQVCLAAVVAGCWLAGNLLAPDTWPRHAKHGGGTP